MTPTPCSRGGDVDDSLRVAAPPQGLAAAQVSLALELHLRGPCRTARSPEDLAGEKDGMGGGSGWSHHSCTADISTCSGYQNFEERGDGSEVVLFGQHQLWISSTSLNSSERKLLCTLQPVLKNVLFKMGHYVVRF
jgi:hypothetical protein